MRRQRPLRLDVPLTSGFGYGPGLPVRYLPAMGNTTCASWNAPDMSPWLINWTDSDQINQGRQTYSQHNRCDGQRRQRCHSTSTAEKVDEIERQHLLKKVCSDVFVGGDKHVMTMTVWARSDPLLEKSLNITHILKITQTPGDSTISGLSFSL